MLKVDCLHSSIGYASNCYVIESNGEYAIVDPSISYTAFARKYGDIGAKIKYIFITHAHFDHMLEIDDWTKQTGLRVIIGEADARGLSDPQINCYKQFLGSDACYIGKYQTVKNGEKIPLGNTEIEIISTPGHTAGGIALYSEHNLIVGDTVFADGILTEADVSAE